MSGIPRSPPLNTGYSSAPVKKPFSNNAVVEELWSIQEMDRICAENNVLRQTCLALLEVRHVERAFYSKKRHWTREKRLAKKKELAEVRLRLLPMISVGEALLRK